MKKIFVLFILVAVGITACEKNSGYVDSSLAATGARVKFVHASHNAPSVIFYGKDTTLKFSSGTPTTTNIIQGTAYAATYPVNDYGLLPAYNDQLQIRIPPNSPVDPNIFKAVGSLNVEHDKNYSVFLVDEYPTVNTIVLNDNISNFNTIGDSMYRARLVNATVGSTAYDVFSVKQNAVIISNVAYKSGSDFVELKIPSSLPDEIQVRLAGTSTIVARITSFTPTQKRTYTWFSRGKTGGTGTAVPALSFYTNQ